ncbi:SDR family NAD(P)-dependent oxidoreductase [soil metagenome]
MDMLLQGKVALVTGSSSGIGVGIAHVLADEGVSVVVHGRDAGRAQKTADDIIAKGGKAAVAVGDLDTDEGAEAVAQAALAAFGQVDILVNNAGGRADNSAPMTFFDIPAELWNASYNRNVTSAVRLIHRLVPQMRERGWGRVIQLSSFAAVASSGGVPEYAPSKTALLSLSLGLSKTLANTGVTVNTISPGMILTGALEQWLDGVAKQHGFPGDREKATRWVLDNSMKQTVDRLGTPEDIGYTTLFLCSPRGEFINGANIRVCGGASPSIN